MADARRELSAARALLAQEISVTTDMSAPPPPNSPPALPLPSATPSATDPELPMLTGVLLDVDDGAARLAAYRPLTGWPSRPWPVRR